MRTDENNNPTAMTVDIANEGGLQRGPDYNIGTPFTVGDKTYYTAMIVLGDPVPRTIQVINKIGFYTSWGGQRWTYIAMPRFIWNSLTDDQKRDIIGFMYQREGGTEIRGYFPNYGKT
jgi:hypothetical protein